MKYAIPTILAFSAGLACTGSIETGNSSHTPDSGGGRGTGGNRGGAPPIADPDEVLSSTACQQVRPGTAPLRRLSNAEYRNTLIDLLGARAEIPQAIEGFVAENESLGFRNNADFLLISGLVAEQFMSAADKLSKAVAAEPGFVKCKNPADSAACASEFIDAFGLRVYRRPLTAEERGRHQATFDKAMATYDFATGVEWVVYGMLQSPSFLYRVEDGALAPAGTHAMPSSYAMASRLSYLLWQSMPDEDLFAAAAAGKLSTREEVLEQARRMLDDPRAARTLEFYRQWLDTDLLVQLKRDPAVFPGLPANLGSLLAEEVDAFTHHLLFESEGDLETLFTAPYTFMNADLARHYDLEGDYGAAFERSDRPHAAGFLTQAGFLAAHDKPTRTSIVLRGVKVRTDVMCELVPAPPNNVELDLESLGEGLSQTERLELHRKEPSCAGCHQLIDPVGVTFETFDAVGRHRTVDEYGKDIDTRTEISKSSDLDGPIADVQDMGRKFAASNQVRQCFVDQNFRFFYGRDYDEQDDCSRARLGKVFAESGYNLRQMLLALTETDAFLYLPADR